MALKEEIFRWLSSWKLVAPKRDNIQEYNGVDFISKKEAIDTKAPSGKFMLTVFGAIAQLEREYILDRQREGIEIARQKGKYKGRKPLAIDKDRFMEVYGRWKSGSIKGVEAMRELNLKPSTF